MHVRDLSVSTMGRPIQVMAFVDWKSQMCLAVRRAENKGQGGPVSLEDVKRTLKYVGRSIGRALNKVKSGARFSVSLRFYSGWRKGYEATDNYRTLTTVSVEDGLFLDLSCQTNVVIRPEVTYGDRMMYALNRRLHSGRGIHLMATMRERDGRKGRFEEKMVDTALASGVVVFAQQDLDAWIVVMAEDDDLVPPVFTAEAVRNGYAERAGRVFLLRHRKADQFLRLDDLLVTI